jgi:hypothetical protein
MPKGNAIRDPEIEAISQVNAALTGLDAGAQQRVLDYVARKLGLVLTTHQDSDRGYDDPVVPEPIVRRQPPESSNQELELDGINTVAKKWIQRSGLAADKLSALFSIGGDDIDVVARKVPGKSKRDRMRSVFLLRGIAAYLASGAPRVTYEQVKEACLHYDAFDSANFSKYLKGMATEISGSTQSGYTLTARGLSSASEMLRDMLLGDSKS